MMVSPSRGRMVLLPEKGKVTRTGNVPTQVEEFGIGFSRTTLGPRRLSQGLVDTSGRILEMRPWMMSRGLIGYAVSMMNFRMAGRGVKVVPRVLTDLIVRESKALVGA